MAEQRLQSEGISTVSQVANRKGVPEPVGVDPGNAGAIGAAVEHPANGVAIEAGTPVAGGDERAVWGARG